LSAGGSDSLIGQKLNVLRAASIDLFSGDIIKAHEELNCLSHSILLHADDLLNVLVGRENAGELSLVQNEVDSLLAHRVKEANRGVIVVHVGHVGH